MQTYKTPGVYVEEISSLPASIAEVETAIPAFFGFTEKGPVNTPTRITSLMEFQMHFGSADPEKGISVTLQVDDDDPQGYKVDSVTIDPSKRSKNVLYYALQLYFVQGGGPCFIISTGMFADGANASLALYSTALATIEKEDEPTLILFPDAFYYLEPEKYYMLMNNSMIQAEKLGDRFAIMDVVDNPDPQTAKDDFRNAISANLDQVKYGAAYYPSLRTTLSYTYDTASVSITIAGSEANAKNLDNEKAKLATLKADAAAARAIVDKYPKAGEEGAPDDKTRKANGTTATEKEAAATAQETLVKGLVANMKKQNFADLSNGLQNLIKQKIGDLELIMPSSPAVAGVYANVDSTRGVWKAPANVSLNYVVAPLTKITDEEQEDLNVDVNAGKSINAIRAFSGKGTLIWGARTLAGNDNEWRYISVRRFFNMVEESVKRSSHWVVFEPNDCNTWVRVKAMIENYLILKWKDGALAGAKPDEAFFVNVGLGQTMSYNDIEEGRMILEIGLAVVRPAEFIILKFSHKIQTS
jgi:uncharacterized protein